MRAPTYPIIVALALMLVTAPSFSAFAQRGERDRILDERTPLRTPEKQTPLRTPEKQTPLRAPEMQTPLRRQTFAGHVYHGKLAWRDGQWHHATHDGREGWWWDVGGFSYFYPEQIEGPPDYVSDVEVADDATSAWANSRTATGSGNLDRRRSSSVQFLWQYPRKSRQVAAG
jgi:hypothetical protein